MTNEEMNEQLKRLNEAADTERFSFADPTEMALYVKHCKECGKNNGVIWTNSREYLTRLNKGVALFDEGKFERALETYKDALAVNPVGITARFEICECYLRLGMLREAEKALLEMKEYLVKPTDIARFYRRVSYIAVEQNEYRLAVACLLYSRSFEKSDYVTRELIYIMRVAQNLERVNDPTQIISEAGLPVLKATSSKPDNTEQA